MLLSLGVIYDLVSQLPGKIKKQTELIVGLLIALVGIIIMLNPLVISEGLVFDTRSILISLSAYFFGTIPILITVLITGLYRLISGGIGVLPGVSTILISAVIGLSWRRIHRINNYEMNMSQAYLLGLLVTIATVLCQLLLPYPFNLEIIRKIALPLLVIYPFVTVLLSSILLRKLKYEWLMRQKLELDAKYKLLFERSRTANLLIDPDSGRIIDSNPAASEMYGWSSETLKKMTIFEINVLTPEEIKSRMNLAKQRNQFYFEMNHRLADGTIKDVEVYSGPIEYNGKKFLYSIIHDVTQRKQYEQTITQQTHTLQQTMQSIVVLLSSMIDLRDPYTLRR